MRPFFFLTAGLFFLFISHIYAQKRIITGSITHEDSRQPIPGVNVVLKGTTVGTITDIEGKYMITVPASGGILVFSFVGLATEEVNIRERSIVDMVMTVDIKQLKDVMVTAYGIEVEKEKLNYSI